MKYKIIDFHTHPCVTKEQSICFYKDHFTDFSPEFTKKYLNDMGIVKICGGLIFKNKEEISDIDVIWKTMKEYNRETLKIKELFGDFVEPTFHIHPAKVDESLEEIDFMAKKGVKIVGELKPQYHRYNFAHDGMDEIIDYATQKNMIISIHTSDQDNFDAMVKKHPDTVFVGAHPGQLNDLTRHLRRMEMNENYYLDVSGTGLFRWGCLLPFIEKYDVDRILFGSDFPVCAPAMYVGGIVYDSMLSEEQKQKILYDNAYKLLYGKK